MKRLSGAGSPAAGVVFALTLLWGGGYVVVSLFLMLWISNAIPAIAGLWFAVVLLLFLLWYLIAATRFYHLAYRRVFGGHPLRYLPLGAVCAMPFAWGTLWYFGRYWDLFWLFIFLFAWLLPLSLALRSVKSAVTAHLSAISGFFGLFLLAFVGEHIYGTVMLPFVVIEKLNGTSAYCRPTPLMIALQQRYGVTGGSWCRFLAAAAVLIGIAYFLRIRLLAWMEGSGMRRVLGKRVPMLWGIMALTYAVSLFLARQGDREVERMHIRLERHFGRPVTAEALRTLYMAGRKSDPAFRRQFQEKYSLLSERFSRKWRAGREIPVWDYYPNSRFALLPEQELRELNGIFRKNSDALAEFDRWFEANAYPARFIVFEAGALQSQYSGGSACWLSGLETLRIRLALENGDLAEARNGMRRMRKNADFYFADIEARSLLSGVAVLFRELDCMELMLESGLPDDALLHQLMKELTDYGNRIPQLSDYMLYCDAVMGIDAMEGVLRFGCGYGEGAELPFELVALRDVRYWCPPAWWMVRRDEAEFMRYCESYGPASGKGPEWPEWAWQSRLHGSWKPDITLWCNVITARLRAERALIAAEQEFRRTGRYPEEPDFLPADPFTGKPMLYRVGPCEIEVEYMTKGKSGTYRKDVTVRAVQVWSVGEDGRDDGGLKACRNGRRSDDIRAIRLLETPRIPDEQK